MTRTSTLHLAALMTLFTIGCAASAVAEAPWTNLMGGKSVEADENKSYALKEENGPWTIMACSFSGQGAEKQAKDLVLEFRRRYKLEAYVYEHSFALDDPNETALGGSASPHRHQYHKFEEQRELLKEGAIKEIAVMVGNYQTVDDPEAQTVLEKVKSADPESLVPSKERPQTRSLARLRIVQDCIMHEGISKFLKTDNAVQGRKHAGPLAHAFVTRNPLLPEDYFVHRGGIDDFVAKMNEGVENSLLDCPGKYTVQVAHFSGEVIIKQDQIQAIESGRMDGPEKNKQSLADAARKAHELTVALREKGYEAYEFHDRYCSLVTIGSFDSVGTPRADGKTEINPKVHQIMQVFGAKQPPGNLQGGYVQLESLVGIFFDAQPIPVEVPKRSIPRALGQRLDVAGQ